MRIALRKERNHDRPILVSRIVVYISATIIVTCLGVAGLTIHQSYDDIRGWHLDQARKSAITAFKAAVDSEIHPTLPQLIEFGSHLIAISNVVGGAYFDSVGEFHGHFGTRPALTWQKAKLDQVERAFVNDRTQMEIFLDASEVDIRYGVVLRFELAETWKAIDSEVSRKITSVLAVMLSSAASLMIIITAIILLPINRLRAAVRHALDDPKDAVSNSLNWRRRDELGELGRGLDQLFYVLSNTFEEDLGNALAIQAHTPYGLIIFGPDDNVEDANGAALAFFGATTPNQIEDLDPQMVRVDNAVTTVRDVMEAGQVCEYGEVRRGEDWIPCLIGGGMIRRQNGAVRRYFIIFCDLTIVREQINQANHDRDTAREEVAAIRAKNRELKSLLDACLAIVEGGRVSAGNDSFEVVMPDRVINAWYQEAIDYGQMNEHSLRHPVLPAVLLPENMAERVFFNALYAVQARSPVEFPRILITTRSRPDGTPRFTISEVSGDDHNPETAPVAPSMNASLYLAGLTNLVKAAGGKVVSISGPNRENTLVFELESGRDGGFSRKLGFRGGRSRAA